MKAMLRRGLVDLLLILAAVALVALWQNQPPRDQLLIDAGQHPGVWPEAAAIPAGGEWCDVPTSPPAPPRTYHPWQGRRPLNVPDHRTIV